MRGNAWNLATAAVNPNILEIMKMLESNDIQAKAIDINIQHPLFTMNLEKKAMFIGGIWGIFSLILKLQLVDLTSPPNVTAVPFLYSVGDCIANCYAPESAYYNIEWTIAAKIIMLPMFIAEKYLLVPTLLGIVLIAISPILIGALIGYICAKIYVMAMPRISKFQAHVSQKL